MPAPCRRRAGWQLRLRPQLCLCLQQQRLPLPCSSSAEGAHPPTRAAVAMFTAQQHVLAAAAHIHELIQDIEHGCARYGTTLRKRVRGACLPMLVYVCVRLCVRALMCVHEHEVAAFRCLQDDAGYVLQEPAVREHLGVLRARDCARRACLCAAMPSQQRGGQKEGATLALPLPTSW